MTVVTPRAQDKSESTPSPEASPTCEQAAEVLSTVHKTRLRQLPRTLYETWKNFILGLEFKTEAAHERGAPNLGGDLQAQSHDLISDLVPPEDPAHKDTGPYASINRPQQPLFRGRIYHQTHFLSGLSRSLPILKRAEQKLHPGVATAYLQIQNRSPGRTTHLLIPVGFRPLPTAQQKSNIRVSQNSAGEFFFSSALAGPFEIALTDEISRPLSENELRIYTDRSGVPSLSDLPSIFGQPLINFLKILQSHPLSPVQKARYLALWLRQYFTYTKKKSAAADALAVMHERKLQCTWAATFWVALTRAYLGLPARVVSGIIGQGRADQPEHSFAVDTPDKRHAWGELYNFGTQRWVSIDATPSLSSNENENSGANSPYFNFADPLTNPLSSAFTDFDALKSPSEVPPHWWQDFSMQREKSTPELLGKHQDFIRRDRLTAYVIDAAWTALLRQHWTEGSPQFFENAARFLDVLHRNIPGTNQELNEDNLKSFPVPAWKNRRDTLRKFLLEYLFLGLEEKSDTLAQAYQDLLVLQELSTSNFLSPAERAYRSQLLKNLGEHEKNQPTPDSVNKLTQKLFTQLLPGPFARQAMQNISWEDKKSLPWLQQLFLTQILRPLAPAPLPPAPQSEALLTQRALLSNYDMDSGPVDNIQQWSRFIRGGWAPPYDLLRALAGDMDQRYFQDIGEETRKTLLPADEVLIVNYNRPSTPLGQSLAQISLDLALTDTEQGAPFPLGFFCQNETDILGTNSQWIRTAEEWQNIYENLDQLQPETSRHPKWRCPLRQKELKLYDEEFMAQLPPFEELGRIRYLANQNEKSPYIKSFFDKLPQDLPRHENRIRTSELVWVEKNPQSSSAGISHSFAELLQLDEKADIAVLQHVLQRFAWRVTETPTVQAWWKNITPALNEARLQVVKQGHVTGPRSNRADWRATSRTARLIMDPPRTYTAWVDQKLEHSRKLRADESLWIDQVVDTLILQGFFLWQSSAAAYLMEALAKDHLGIPLAELPWRLGSGPDLQYVKWIDKSKFNWDPSR